MRDHLFQLLGTSFFPRWKEKHQVRLTVSIDGLNLHMPPPYSIVTQESEQGSWHVPTVVGDDLETPRQWICATRARDPSSRNNEVVQSSTSNIL
ncbi:Proteinaceous RNase P 1 like [Actinidia chinensis var. chinensis]|uniref:ribonuclease P n=1 Tax=Actinidia chinensis var. chinensis TaxID=1590841 RepID=A0A2R6RCH1_ACTCC|nr:Proteinaceous RNase P 1 like [Actinidia chinensis var. chinensis]